ncbi:quinone oxidoreductase family protein [Zhihengliuella flava]|uniref:NADPH2:quinone reductase n=1 Tax=Zhihengliuella flava TaxID=1285193 RepID=A0A931D7Z7_9MICC|nr:quinone oxidoreductase [Zhihengliuella flava]MBG6083742.1 NADPH2:quinone reductase [Zhihengliuella flava]
MPSTAHYAVHAPTPGGPEVLTRTEIQAPTPGPGEIALAVAAVGVNFIETYQRSGVYPVDFPFTPGTEAAGTVSAVGEGVTRFAVGDRVATAEGIGTYATAVVLDAERAVPVPDSVPDDVAAAVALQGFTAHYLVNSSYRVHEGDIILTYAGAGGVGGLLTQLLKLRGATVITTASTEAKAELAREAGADYVVGYDDVAATVASVTGGRGVDAVYDGIGQDTFDGSLAALRTRGTLVLFGGASGQVPPVDLQRLNAAGSVFVTRPKLADHLLDAEERAWRAREIFGLVASGDLTVRIGATFPLAEAGRAHADLEARRTTGKLLLLP